MLPSHHMRTMSILVALAAGCGGAAAPPPATPSAAPPPPPEAYEAARAPDLLAVAADDTHLYWVDAGIHRRAHGGEAPAERLLAHDGWIDRIAIGTDDVFFVDDGYRLRVIPKAGGAPSELGGLDDGATALIADGDGVWVLTGARLERWSRDPGERRIELPGYGSALAIAGGDAFVTIRDGDATLYRVDLATGKATALSEDWAFAEALALGVSGSSVLAAGPGGVVTIPRAGGTPRFALTLPAYALASDPAGYVASTDLALVAHDRGAPPRLLAASGGSPAVALGGRFAYHVGYAPDTGEAVLRGEPRTAGAEMLRVPEGAEVTALAADGDRLHVALAHRDGIGEIVALTTKGPQHLVHADGWVEALRVEGERVAWWMEGALFRAAGGRAVLRSEEVNQPPLALHRGLVYWSDGVGLRAIPLDGDGPSIPLVPDLGEHGLAIGFADDHLYAVEAGGPAPGLRRVDERGGIETAWTYPGDASLAPDLAVVGGAVYVHDDRRVWRIPTGGGAAAVIYDDPDAAIVSLLAVGGRLVARRIARDAFDELLELSPDGDPPRRRWSGLLGGAATPVAAGATAVFAHSHVLGAVLRIPID